MAGRSSGGAPGLVVCHGCCCARDAAGARDAATVQRTERLATAVKRVGTQVRIVDCLGPCDYSDVLVVRPSPAGRTAGARPVWLGWTGPAEVELVRGWVLAGGPGVAEMPDDLIINLFTPPRRDRQAVEELPA